jgi:hypothetical protein
MLNQICTWTAKTRAVPSLHRDSFLAKVPGLYPVRRQVTPTNFIAGPLAQISRALKLATHRHLSSLILTRNLSALYREKAFAQLILFETQFDNINPIPMTTCAPANFLSDY